MGISYEFEIGILPCCFEVIIIIVVIIITTTTIDIDIIASHRIYIIASHRIYNLGEREVPNPRWHASRPPTADPQGFWSRGLRDGRQQQDVGLLLRVFWDGDSYYRYRSILVVARGWSV